MRAIAHCRLSHNPKWSLSRLSASSNQKASRSHPPDYVRLPPTICCHQVSQIYNKHLEPKGKQSHSKWIFIANRFDSGDRHCPFPRQGYDWRYPDRV
jgi:hypothetical protein